MKKLLVFGLLVFALQSCSRQTYPPDGDQRSDSTYSNYYEGYYDIDTYMDYFIYPIGYMTPYGYYSGYYGYPYCGSLYYPYHYYHYYPHNYNYHYFKSRPNYQPYPYRQSSTPAQVVRYHGNRPANQNYRPAPAVRPQVQHYNTPHTMMPSSRPQMHSSGGSRGFRR